MLKREIPYGVQKSFSILEDTMVEMDMLMVSLEM